MPDDPVARRVVAVVGGLLVVGALTSCCLFMGHLRGMNSTSLESTFGEQMSRYVAAYPEAPPGSPYRRGKILPITLVREYPSVDGAEGEERAMPMPPLPSSETPPMTGEVYASIYQRLPEEMKPESAEEVSSVAQIRCNRMQVGVYEEGGSNGRATGTAYRWLCAVTLIDLERGLEVDFQKFTGSPPPARVRGTGDGHGDKPESEILGYLQALPEWT